MEENKAIYTPTGKDKAIEVIKRPLPKSAIKERDGGFGKKLKYIEGETVIDLLNEAFGHEWDFYVISKDIIRSEPKQVTEFKDRKMTKVFNADGTPKMEAQPPYVEILGELVAPGFGRKQQYGTKILLGGASEQEGAAKAAATDALKKCATLIGIGIELYKDGVETPPQKTEKKINPWEGKDAEIKKLQELKALLGINENKELNSYVIEFTGDKNATYEMVTPTNIAAFNKFLIKKTEK